MKRLAKITLTLLVIVVAFAFAACHFDSEATWEYSVEGKTDSVQCLNAIFEDTLKDPNFVATCKVGGTVQFTENVKGTTSCYVGSDGAKSYSYVEGGQYYYALETEEYHYYSTTDTARRGYDEDAKSYYDNSYCTCMSTVKLMATLPADKGTFTCTGNGEEKNNESSESLIFEFSVETGTIKLTVTAKNRLVKSVTIEKTENAEAPQTTAAVITFEYGSAAITLPDTTVWDAEVEAMEAQAARIEANGNAQDARDGFLEDLYCADNLVVTARFFDVDVFVETIADGIDRVEYSDHTTYTFTLGEDEDADAYFVSDGSSKYYTVNEDDYYDNSYVFINYPYVGIKAADEFFETADFTCEIEDDVMTFIAALENDEIVLVATKVEGKVKTMEFTVNGATLSYSVEYGSAHLEKPSLDGFENRSAA